jgi:hypothetical protein
MSKRQAAANLHAITHGKEQGKPRLVPERIELTKTEQMAVRQILQEQAASEINRKAVIEEIAARVGLKIEQIGTEYSLFADALVKQPPTE